MGIKDCISKNSEEFKSICRKHKVDTIYAFGSSVTIYFNPKTSDIDLLIEVKERDPIDRGELLMSLWDDLELFFNRKVDLLTPTSLKNPYLKKSIDETKVLIYEGSGEKILI